MERKPEKRVLVIEDEANWQELIGELVQEVAKSLGYSIQVTFASGFSESLTQLNRTSFNCITVDNELEKEKGVVAKLLLDRIAHLPQRVPVIVVTGVVDPDDVRDFFKDYRIAEFFWKANFEPKKFRQTLARLLADRRRKVSARATILDGSEVGSKPERLPSRQEATAMALEENLLSLQHELADAREKVRLIQERKAEFVFSTDIPLQLVKEERRLLDRIAELEQQVATQPAKGDKFDVRQDGLGSVPKQLRRKKKNEIDLEIYTDFELHISSDGHARARSNEGERVATLSLDVPNEVSLTMKLIEANSTDGTLLKEFGKRLYKNIFPDLIHTHLNQTEAVARDRRQKVRIRLTIEPDILARLPWEFIYREEHGYFLAINPNTVLSRYLDLPLPPKRVRRQEGLLHLLTIIANPIDQPSLDPDEWEKIIARALAAPIQDGKIRMQTVKRATFEEIRDALLGQKPDIIQFVGHGIYRNGKGYLALVDSDSGKTWTVDDEKFANIFLGTNDQLGLMCLATCESAKSDSPQSFLGIAPQIVERGIPAVVAMQYSVLVSTAKIFLENFYKAVAARKPIDWAVQSARNAVSIKAGLDNREFATPVLYMRAKDGNIF